MCTCVPALRAHKTVCRRTPGLISCGVGACVLYSEQLTSLGLLPGCRSRLQTAVTSKPTIMYMLPSPPTAPSRPTLLAAFATAELAALLATLVAFELARNDGQSSLRAPPCTRWPQQLCCSRNALHSDTPDSSIQAHAAGRLGHSRAGSAGGIRAGQNRRPEQPARSALHDQA